jgi:hypothetical protein
MTTVELDSAANPCGARTSVMPLPIVRMMSQPPM